MCDFIPTYQLIDISIFAYIIHISDINGPKLAHMTHVNGLRFISMCWCVDTVEIPKYLGFAISSNSGGD